MSEKQSETLPRGLDAFYSPLAYPIGTPVPSRSHQELEYQCAARGVSLEWSGKTFFAYEPGTDGTAGRAWIWDHNGRPTRHDFINGVYAGGNPTEEGASKPLSDTLFSNVFGYDAEGHLVSAWQVVVDADGNDIPFRNAMDSAGAIVYDAVQPPAGSWTA